MSPTNALPPVVRAGSDAPSDLPFDGVICFGGEDWWYHNRGHYDMQMMRELSRLVPVVYVNSIGMRFPRPGKGRMFLTRIRRKIASLRRGLVEVSPSMSVLTAPSLPGPNGRSLTRALLGRAVRRAARRSGITRPLVWVACPTAADVIDGLDPARVVYQRTDRYETFADVDPHAIAALDVQLKERADVTLFCSSALYRRESNACTAALLVDHGVDAERFGAPHPEPDDVRDVPRPRVGFIGGVDDHTFDAALFREIVTRRPGLSFVVVGDVSLPGGLPDEPNVIGLGRRPFDTVPAYLGACDALIMPWRRSEWIEACNPVKLKEYLASGRPVVSTSFPEIEHYRDVVAVADDAASFVRALDRALRTPGSAQTRRARVQGESWSSKAALVVRALCVNDPADLEPPAPVIESALTACAHELDASERPRLVPGAHGARPMRPDTDPETVAADGRLSMIVLAGGLRLSPLVEAARCSPLDLWIGPKTRLLDVWLHRAAELDTIAGGRVPVRVIHDDRVPAPWPRDHTSRLRIEREPLPLRGPAGIVRDACSGPRRAEPADANILVVEAARLAAASLLPLVHDHDRHDADVTVAANADGSPAGVYLIAARLLDDIPEMGFVDLKEQWLDRLLAAGRSVRVHTLPAPGVMPVRTREQLIAAARCAAGLDPDDRATPMRIICAGAFVGPGATIIDSIVMPGAVVEADAIIARSVVCPDTRVQAGTDIVDSVVRNDLPRVYRAPTMQSA